MWCGHFFAEGAFFLNPVRAQAREFEITQAYVYPFDEVKSAGDKINQSRVLRDVIPPNPPGPEGSNGNGLVRAQ
jgi:hypothetical protein